MELGELLKFLKTGGGFVLVLFSYNTQLTFTSSKSTIETLEKGVKFLSGVFLLTVNIFHTFLCCFYC